MHEVKGWRGIARLGLGPGLGLGRGLGLGLRFEFGLGLGLGLGLGRAPVIARSARVGLSRARESMAVTMVTPADGPSLGVAPSGTCTC